MAIFNVRWQETKSVWVSASDEDIAVEVALGLFYDRADLVEQEVVELTRHAEEPEEGRVYGLPS